MMAREEAITILQDKYDCCKSFYDLAAHPEEDYPEMAKYLQALQIALSALRPVSRERVEKVFRGCPECKPRCGLCIHMGAWDKYGKPYVCEQCIDCSNFESDQRFCEVCGAPMTDEAVDIRLKELEALKDAGN